jgi:hypothetical protein
MRQLRRYGATRNIIIHIKKEKKLILISNFSDLYALTMANGLQRTTIAEYLSEQIQAQVS